MGPHYTESMTTQTTTREQAAILDAIRANTTAGGWSPLAAVREDAALTRPDFNQAMTELAVAGLVVLVPEDNQKTLRPADESAALHIGGELKHLARIA
jgi:hypothetical protein